MMGLLALLLGFTLSIGVSRCDERRDVISHRIQRDWHALAAGRPARGAPARRHAGRAARPMQTLRIALGGAGAVPAEAIARSPGLERDFASHVDLVGGRAGRPARPEQRRVECADQWGQIQLIDIHELRISSIENFLPVPLFMLLIAIASVAIWFFAWSFGALQPGPAYGHT